MISFTVMCVLTLPERIKSFHFKDVFTVFTSGALGKHVPFADDQLLSTLNDFDIKFIN